MIYYICIQYLEKLRSKSHVHHKIKKENEKGGLTKNNCQGRKHENDRGCQISHLKKCFIRHNKRKFDIVSCGYISPDNEASLKLFF